jgi:hypothetical protein
MNAVSDQLLTTLALDFACLTGALLLWWFFRIPGGGAIRRGFTLYFLLRVIGYGFLMTKDVFDFYDIFESWWIWQVPYYPIIVRSANAIALWFLISQLWIYKFAAVETKEVRLE